MTGAAATCTYDLESIVRQVRKYWGFDRLRPLQEAAIRAGLERRDSLVVLPTGGGKSLCYQVPPVLAERTDIVVSPLISLMKDQVDGLRACGYPAAALHSGATEKEREETSREIAAGKFRLVFVAPERLLSAPFLRLVQSLDVRAFAIDEAHCISHWGHDFRPEYRRLATLKERFPNACIQAFTATATQRVRTDIVEQLQLRDPTILVGSFDRPNLIYRIVPRVDVDVQVLQVIKRHAGEAVIVYCLSRRDTEELADYLRAHRVRAEAYHAGLSPDIRRKTQDAFAEEKLDVVAATVAFGMGIDRSNVRCVIHASLPKSIEHYQQETGRAGRDGLEAECVLFYSAEDVLRWESLIRQSAGEADRPAEVVAAMNELLRHMQRYCNGLLCRHRKLTEYFGQSYDRPTCGACDVCLGEVEGVIDGTVTAQKILSCIARVGERFGVGHVVDVLLGSNTERIRRLEHHQLSTYGLLSSWSKKTITNMVYQLIDQNLLTRTAGDKPVLCLNGESWEVMRGKRPVNLVRPKTDAPTKSYVDEDSWEGVDRGLFERLRELRRAIAQERGVPPYVIFGDATLRQMARVRPGSHRALRRVHGVGERKLADFGDRFLSEILAYCGAHDLAHDVAEDISAGERESRPRRQSRSVRIAFQLFSEGKSVEEVMTVLDRARSTAFGYLADFIASARPPRIDAWVDDSAYARVAQTARETGLRLLKPIFDRLNGEVPYEIIRLVVAHLEATSSSEPSEAE